MRLNGPVNTIDKYTAPATRADLLSGYMAVFSFVVSLSIKSIRADRDNAAGGLLRRGTTRQLSVRTKDRGNSGIQPGSVVGSRPSASERQMPSVRIPSTGPSTS